jgi:hydrogenase large subunit
VQEFVTHSWYDYSGGKRQGLHPHGRDDAGTTPGPSRPTSSSTWPASYSWLKSPRWRGKPMEVGPLARMLMLYAGPRAHVKALADGRCASSGSAADGAVLHAGPHAARTLESKLFADQMMGWLDQLVAQHQGR